MGKSAHAHRRHEIEAEFRKGLEPAAVAAAHPELPRATIYEWYKRRSQRPEEEPGNNVVRLVASTGPLDPKAEFRWVRSVLRQHILSPNESTGVVVQAANAYMKSIQLEATTPKEEEDEPIPEQERIERINQLLDTARTRRIGQTADPADG